MRYFLIGLLIFGTFGYFLLKDRWVPERNTFDLTLSPEYSLRLKPPEPPYTTAVEAIMADDVQATRRLLAEGSKLDTTNEFGDTVLIWAANKGDLKLVKELLGKGADPNQRGYLGRGPLHWAAEKGFSDIVEVLLAKGAEIDLKSESAETPLHLATARNQTSMIESLLKHGADINATDAIGDSPVMKAMRIRSEELTTYLVLQGADLAFGGDTHAPLKLALDLGVSHFLTREKILEKVPNLNEMMEEVRETKIVNLAEKPYIELSKLALRIHELVNIERQKHGLAPIGYDMSLEAIARDHSADMHARRFFNHVNPNQEDPTDRAKRAGVPSRRVTGNRWVQGIGENIYKSKLYSGSQISFEGRQKLVTYSWLDMETLAQRSVQGWMNSPGHRENILNELYLNEGIGLYVSSEGEYYATQDLF